MKITKHSRQREAIKEFLMTRKDHPSADTIYIYMREVFPNISLGTVYRNLALLTELGEIQKLHYGTESDHFDGDISLHHHIICRECGSINDLKMENIDFINTLANQNFDGIVEGHNIHFYGICKNCKNNLKLKNNIDKSKSV